MLSEVCMSQAPGLQWSSRKGAGRSPLYHLFTCSMVVNAHSDHDGGCGAAPVPQLPHSGELSGQPPITLLMTGRARLPLRHFFLANVLCSP